MAVLPMKRVLICGMKKDRKAVLELVQRLESVEIDAGTEEEDEVFVQTDVSSSAQLFQKNAASAARALEILNAAAPEEKSILSSFEGRKEMSVEEYEKQVSRRDEIMRDVGEILRIDKELSEAKADIPRIETQIEALGPWMELDVPLSFKGTKKTAAFIGTFPEELSESEVLSRLASLLPEIEDLNVDVVRATPEITSVMVICMKKDADAVDNALRHLNFSRPPVSDEVPARQKELYQGEITAAMKRMDEARQELQSYAGRRDDLKFAVDYFTLRADKYKVLGSLSQSRRTFLLKGYVPEEAAPKLELILTRSYEVCVEFSDPSESDDVPVLLKNNAFSSPVESVIESYSMPGKGELDPTMPVACFYYFMFGMMLSDFAYGAVMAAATFWILRKFKNMEPGMKKMMTMFCYCGLGTMLSGVLFGSYFGDAPIVIAKTFFGKDITIWSWIDPLNESMKMLVFAFVIGLIHLFTGLILNCYGAIKQKKYADAIYDSVFWIMLVGGLLLYGLTTDIVTGMFGLNKIAQGIGTFGGICAVIASVGIILTGGRESKNWFKRTLKGAYALYGVTGYLSDILSYSRLLALGLATSVISSVFNQMGTMAGSGVFGVLIFIVVFLIGHTLNLAINALGAYVHTNRLQFVEFFGKFYNGGGRKFEPFAVKTKYFKFKEEN